MVVPPGLRAFSPIRQAVGVALSPGASDAPAATASPAGSWDYPAEISLASGNGLVPLPVVVTYLFMSGETRQADNYNPL